MPKPKANNRSLYLLLGWPCYFLLYTLTEKWIPYESCHVIQCPLDTRIPFWEGFVVFYVGWYFLIAGSLVYFLLTNEHSFRKLQLYIIIVQCLATIIYILYPSRQELRPEAFPRQNVLTRIVAYIYRIDTPTGVCPSLHVAISLGIASVWCEEREVSLWLRRGIVLFCLLVCMSVAFLKQHSVVDILAALPVWLAGEWILRRE